MQVWPKGGEKWPRLLLQVPVQCMNRGSVIAYWWKGFMTAVYVHGMHGSL